MKKRIILFGLISIMIIMNCLPALAISGEKLTYAESIAPELKELGMFLGTDKGFELERVANRAEGLTMLIRLLGKETEASNGTWEHPFDDVPSWANKIVGYAYTNGLTSGVSDKKFGSADNINSTQYITFVLRALGYSDLQEINDFTWDNPYKLASEIKLIEENEYNKESEFLRADVAVVSYNALSKIVKGGEKTLKEKLPSASQIEEIKKEEPKKEPVKKEEPKKEEPAPDKGVYELRKAGFFETEEEGRKLNVIDKSNEYVTARNIINGQISETYMVWYNPGLTTGYGRQGDAEFTYNLDTNAYELRIFAWRKSYDSDVTENKILNAVLETLYYLSGDKEVAMGLFNWVDAIGINGRANSDNFGFKDVNSNTIEMNGVQIEFEFGNGYSVFRFK